MKINKYVPPLRWLFLCVLFIPRIKKWYQRKLFGFAIGEPLELNEFKLEVLETILVNEIELEVYQYLMDEPFWLCKNKVKEIKLYYNADILMRIDYLFESEIKSHKQQDLNNLSQILELNLSIRNRIVAISSKIICANMQ